jgi:hypothetical protein
MSGPNAYSGKKRVRDFEKSVLGDVYADLCEPGDHHADCPERPAVCPVAREEQDGGDA